jgi:Pro-kumamolisin, activation domain
MREVVLLLAICAVVISQFTNVNADVAESVFSLTNNGKSDLLDARSNTRARAQVLLETAASSFHERVMNILPSQFKGKAAAAAVTTTKAKSTFDTFVPSDLSPEYFAEKKKEKDAKAKATATHVFKESAVSISHRADLVKLARAPADLEHEVMFVIKPRNMDKLERIVHEISDPNHAKYGQHLTRDQVTEITGNKDARVSYPPHT